MVTIEAHTHTRSNTQSTKWKRENIIGKHDDLLNDDSTYTKSQL